MGGIPGKMGPSQLQSNLLLTKGRIPIGEEKAKLPDSKPRRSGVPHHPSFCVGDLHRLVGGGEKEGFTMELCLLLFRPSPFSPAE